MLLLFSVMFINLETINSFSVISNKIVKKVPRTHLNMRWGLKGNTPAPTTTPDGVPIRDTGTKIINLFIISFN